MTQTNVPHPYVFVASCPECSPPCFATVVKDLFAAVEEKNGGKLTPDQISRISLKLGQMLGNPESQEVTQNEKGQVRRVLFYFTLLSVPSIVSDVN